MAKLPILMYHHVTLQKGEGLAISKDALEVQFQYLQKNGYRSYHLSELQRLPQLEGKKHVVITFDDAYVSQLQYAVPLLQKYQLKATFFIPLQYVGKEDSWNETTAPIMNVESLKSLDPQVVELAHHSYAHKKYSELSAEDTEEDMQKAFAMAKENDLLLNPYVAYPYGKYPRKDPEKARFFEQLHFHQFQFGLRIGNRVNDFPFKHPFEIQRIDVKGEWSLGTFRRKIRYGKLW